MRGIHRWPVNSPHKGTVTRKMFPFDDVIMYLQAMQSDDEAQIIRIYSTGIWSLTNIAANRQIPQCPFNISRNSPFRTDISTFLFWVVYCGIWGRCNLRFTNLIFCKYCFQVYILSKPLTFYHIWSKTLQHSQHWLRLWEQNIYTIYV